MSAGFEGVIGQLLAPKSFWPKTFLVLGKYSTQLYNLYVDQKLADHALLAKSGAPGGWLSDKIMASRSAATVNIKIRSIE